MSALVFINLNVVMVCRKKVKYKMILIVTIQKHYVECLQSFMIMANSYYNKIQASLRSLHNCIKNSP